MGVDFVRRCAPTFHKALDRRAVELRTPTLFASSVTCAPRTASAEVCDGTSLVPGEKVLLRAFEGKLVAQRGNAIVARLPNPPNEYLDIVKASGGIAGAEVKAVQPLSGIAEVSICE